VSVLPTNKILRNIQKFKLKYGFDPHLYADGLALGLNNDELAQSLGVKAAVLENFLLDQSLKKNKNNGPEMQAPLLSIQDFFKPADR